MKHLSLFTSKNMLALLIVLGLVGCAMWWLLGNKAPVRAASQAHSGEGLQVVASSYVAYTLAQTIGGDKVRVDMLVPPGTEPHHFEPTPGNIIAVEKADVFLYTSSQAEPWVPSILNGLGSVNAVEIAEVEREEDPHVWMTPYGALSMARVISDAFIEKDPDNKTYYQANLQGFEKQMQQLHEDLKRSLSHCQQQEVIHIGHLSFGPLAHLYGLDLSNLSAMTHQAEHSVQRLAQLVQQIRRKKAVAIFAEEMLPADLSDTLAQETQVRVLPLYAIEEISRSDFEKAVDYETLMRRNLKSLQEGLQCPA